MNLANYLTLERPLAVLDLETTGFDAEKERIVQIALTIHYPHRDPIQWMSLVNPGIPIRNASESHGITDEAVKDSPSFLQIAPALAPKILHVDIAGYNVDFDITFLRAEMRRSGVTWEWSGCVIDAYRIYKRKKPHNLTNAYLEYGGDNGEPLPPGHILDGAHNAGVDVQATEMALRGQLLRHSDLPRNVKELELWCFPQKPNAIDRAGKFLWVNDVACITFGKHAKNGPRPMKEVPRDYFDYIANPINGFPPDMREIAAAAAAGKFPVKGGLL